MSEIRDFDDFAESPLRQLSYAEMMDATDKGWLIGSNDKPILLADAMWLTFGPEKNGKTYSELEKAFCIGWGLPYHEFPTKQGNTAYVIAEGGLARIRKRVFALCEKYREELTVLGFETNQQIIDAHKFNLISSAVNLYDATQPTGADELLAQLFNGPYAAVWLDTWQRILQESGGHVGDAEITTQCLRTCDLIRQRLECTIVLVAHTPLSDVMRPKGMNELQAVIDGATQCLKHGTKAATRFQFTSMFQRHAENDFTEWCERIPKGEDGVLMPADAPAHMKGSDGLNNQQRERLDRLAAMVGCTDDGWVSVSDWRDASKPDGFDKLDDKANAAWRQEWGRDLSALGKALAIRTEGGVRGKNDTRRAQPMPADSMPDIG